MSLKYEPTLHSKQRVADVEAACAGKERVFVLCRRGIFIRIFNLRILVYSVIYDSG